MSRKTAPWMPKPEKGEVFEIGCVTGHGKNKTEARENAISLAAEALNQRAQIPHVLTLRGMSAVIWHDHEGYHYARIDENKPATQSLRNIVDVEKTATLEDVLAGLLLHFAQQTFDGTNTECPFDAERFPVQAEDYAENCKMHMKYLKLKNSGLFDANEMHHVLGNFYSNFNFSAEQMAVINSL